MKFSLGDDAQDAENAPEEVRVAREAEKKLEKIKKKKRNELIRKLSEIRFKEAEEEAEKLFNSNEKYYEFAAAVAELLMSRKLARARKDRLKSQAFLKTLYKNRNMNTARKISHKKLRNTMEDMKENIEQAPEEIEKSKAIMKRYGSQLHRVDGEGEKDMFEYLVELISLKRDELDELEQDYNEFVNAKNEAVDGNYEPMKQLIQEIEAEQPS